jgi:TM2 domain-containing membrane protein YozV
MKNRVTAILFCFFVGALGGHKLYLGQIRTGIIFFIFAWTLIPAFIAFFDFIMLVLMSDKEFDRQFNSGAGQAIMSSRDSAAMTARDSAAALMDLKRLYDQGVITAEEYEEKRKKLLRNI